MLSKLLLLLFLCPTCHVSAQDLIGSIVKGGITSDGDVASAPTDFLINLSVPFDNSLGLSLDAGKTFQIILPSDFVNTETLSAEPAFASKTCTPGALECNTSAFIQGWPQRPIVNAVPPVTGGSEHTTATLVYDFDYEAQPDGSHVFTHTALTDIGPGSAPPGPGIKQVHMILPGFRNPDTAGSYEIQVVAETGPDGATETGTADLLVRPSIAPSINLTSIYDAQRRNTVYQEVRPGDDIVPYNFWLWDSNGDPMLGVEVVGNDLVQEGQVVGSVSISAPAGATGQSIASTGPSSLVNEVFFGQETARFEAQLTVGDELGEYVSTFTLNDGTTQQLTVNVVPEPASVSLLCVPLTAVLLLRKRRQRIAR